MDKQLDSISDVIRLSNQRLHIVILMKNVAHFLKAFFEIIDLNVPFYNKSDVAFPF